MTGSWRRLGAVPPTALVDARLQLHYAAQVVAAVGATLLEPRPDDSHPNLEWHEGLGALAGRVVPVDRPFRVALHPAELALSLRHADEQRIDALPLEGLSLHDATAWLGRAIQDLGVGLPAGGLKRPRYDLPDHPIARGARFSQEPAEAFAELEACFANAQAMLRELASRTPGNPEVRCWPHHFDLALLEVVATDAEGGLAKSVGVGLSPGDESYPVPYWYVSPWPYPDPARLAALESGGQWHTEGFTAAILTASELLNGDPSAQAARLRAFLDSAVAASRRALD